MFPHEGCSFAVVKFSLWAGNNRTWSEIVDLTAYIESVGWQGFWLPDHYMSQTADDTSGSEPALDCWTVLAAVAVAAPKLRLTSMVSPVTIHHPVVLTKRVVTVDQISNGRAVFGLGAGWQVNEHRGYGFELHEPGERVTHFIEAIRVIRELLDNERANFDGRWYTLTDATFEPKPVQSPLPILVGTSRPRMLRTVARYANSWNTWGNPTLIATVTERFMAACEKEGRDPASIRRSAQALVYITDSDAKRDELLGKINTERAIVGSTAEIVDVMGQYADAGLDEFALPDFNLGALPAQRRETIERFHEEVVSKVSNG
jgi:alkanesulfonate monooxygenase SsuD/methylene tetrahydromethanopterin reductase-like flavin-dependent oxidoreductase (luciferase family)